MVVNQKKKVLFFIQPFFGGAEKMTLYIANCLDTNKYEIVYYVIGNDWGATSQMIPKTVMCHLVKVKSFKDFLLFRMIYILYKEKPFCAFSSAFPLNWRLCLASVFYPKAKIIVRSDNYLYTQSFIQKLRLFIAYRFLDFLIVQTDEMRDEHIKLLRIEKSKIATYSNPVDEERILDKIRAKESPFESNVVNYVFVGRIRKVKGVDLLLNAFALLQKDQPNSMLYIIGDITGVFMEYYKEMITLVSDLKIENRVIFTGFSDNPYVYMKYADCVILPSREEGLPNVVIESLFLGTPVAVTRSVPVIERIVDNGINGYIADVDDVEGFTIAMQQASKLGRVRSSYKPVTKEEYVKLF